MPFRWTTHILCTYTIDFTSHISSQSKSKLIEYHQQYLISLQNHLINPPLDFNIYIYPIYTKGHKNAILFEIYSLLLTCFELSLIKAKHIQKSHQNLFDKLIKTILNVGKTKKALLRSISNLRAQSAHYTKHHILRNRLSNPIIIKALYKLLKNPFSFFNIATPIHPTIPIISKISSYCNYCIANPSLFTLIYKTPPVKHHLSDSIPHPSKSKTLLVKHYLSSSIFLVKHHFSDSIPHLSKSKTLPVKHHLSDLILNINQNLLINIPNRSFFLISEK